MRSEHVTGAANDEKANLQQFNGINAAALLKREEIGVVAGCVQPALTRSQNVADGFEQDLGAA